MQYARFIERISPPGLDANEEDARISRVVVGGSFALIIANLVNLPFIGLFKSWDHPLIPYILLLVLGYSVVYASLWVFRSLQLTVNLFLLVLFLGAEYAILDTGVLYKTLSWMSLIPLLAMFTLGTRAALGWSAAILATVIPLALAQEAGLFPSDPGSFTGHPFVDNTVLISSFLAAMLCLAWLYEDARKTALVARDEALAEAKKAQNQAEVANRAKSDFLAKMSHEIRTPMNGILGMLDLLKDSGLVTVQRDYADLAHQSANQLLHLINQILDLSRVESGHLQLEPRPFELQVLVQDVVEQSAVLAESKNIELLVRYPLMPIHAVGDGPRIRQVLINLIGNAMKFSEGGHIFVALDLEDPDPDEDRLLLRVSVQDTGPGIPDEIQALIFEKFQQGDSTITQTDGGAGLGLAICKEFVHLMDGVIGVQSELGHGSEFWFQIPIALDTSHPESVEIVNGLGKRSVLIVDDHDISRDILEDMAHRWQMRPTVCADGASALDALHAAEAARDLPELAIIDHQMSGMDGLSLGQAIAEQYPGVRSVLLTTVAFSKESTAIREAGYAGYLSKPIFPAELREVLLAALQGVKRRDTAVAHTREDKTPEDDEALALGSGKSRQIRVLVVEDNVVNQKVASEMLRRVGCHVEMACNGLEALDALERASYDMVFMDMEMPKLNGLETTARVRAMESPDGPRLPIIAMTAHAMQGDRERFLAADMDGYLSKPISFAELARTLENFVPMRLPSQPGI